MALLKYLTLKCDQGHNTTISETISELPDAMQWFVSNENA